MSLLLESIKILDRIPQNLEGHNARLNRSRKALFGAEDEVDLRKSLSVPEDLKQGVNKCRVIYAEKILGVEYIPYVPRMIRSLEIVDGGDIDYEHKYLDKSRFEDLKRGIKADDILIIKGGCVTDTSFSNIILYDGTRWLTPVRPLLKGTKRRLLLDSGQIYEKEIKEKDLTGFEKAVLVNAMLDFDVNKSIPIENIIRR